MRNTFIYCLYDPDTNLPRYIGKADYPNERFIRHINVNISDKTHRGNWIRNLQKQYKLPILEILDEIKYDEWRFWERHYISLYKSWGFKLTNYTDGGDGAGSGIYNPMYGKQSPMYGLKHTAITLLKMKIKKIGENNPFYGKHHTPETKEKISIASKGKYPEKLKEKINSLEYKTKQIISNSKKRLKIIDTFNNNEIYFFSSVQASMGINIHRNAITNSINKHHTKLNYKLKNRYIVELALINTDLDKFTLILPNDIKKDIV